MDELEAQLRRYADAAERQIPPTPSARPTGYRRGRLLAVAAVVALVGGSIGAFAVSRERSDYVDSVLSDHTTTAPPSETCPTPADQPRPHHLQIAPRSVSGGTVDRTNQGSTPSSESFSAFVYFGDDDFFEVQVRELGAAEPVPESEPGAATVQLRVCDPFGADGNRRAVTGQLTERRYDRHLSFTLGDRWSVTLRAAPAAQSALTPTDLVDVVAGLSWPAPVGAEPTTTAPTTGTGDCPLDPPMAIEVGSLLVTAAPDGYEPQLPVLFETFGGPVDLGGTELSTLTLLHPRHGPIQVTSFGVESPSAYIDKLVLGDAERRTVRLCRRGRGESGDLRATLTRSGGKLAAAAQVWEYEGFLVLGPIGSEDAILEVVGGLRLPF